MTREAFDFTALPYPTTSLAVIWEAGVMLDAAPARSAVALPVIVGICSPSYRPVRAVVVNDGAGRTSGNLSSGCIERDVDLRAGQSVQDGPGAIIAI